MPLKGRKEKELFDFALPAYSPNVPLAALPSIFIAFDKMQPQFMSDAAQHAAVDAVEMQPSAATFAAIAAKLTSGVVTPGTQPAMPLTAEQLAVFASLLAADAATAGQPPVGIAANVADRLTACDSAASRAARIHAGIFSRKVAPSVGFLEISDLQRALRLP